MTPDLARSNARSDALRQMLDEMPETAPDLAKIAKAIGIRQRKGGWAVMTCDGKYPLFPEPMGGTPWLWRTLEDACAVAAWSFLPQPPNPFHVGCRVILRRRTETLYGKVIHFFRRNTIGIGLDPRGWGLNGDCKCTFQLPQGGLLGGEYRYEDLAPDPARTPFTYRDAEEHARELEEWGQRIRPLLLQIP